ncbi:MAG TPA: carboxyl transferase domain-containing protein [Dehalococcoidales bacterium]|nr:carboxyl transferase domain-containing protein [Dehalococcoidales bacterium]
MEDELDRLNKLEEQVKASGGEERIQRQHASGKLTARERIDLLFDAGTFHELDLFVQHHCTNFGMEKVSIPADAVVTGYGKVNGRTVCVFSQDFTSRGGTLGEMHARKICKVMDMALTMKAPMVGLIDSGGARIQEGINALNGYGNIFFRNSCASGVIPQISVIMGPAAGGAVYSPAMTDFVFMVKKTSYMYITGPDVVKAATSEDMNDEELGGAMTHNIKSGVAQFACENDKQAIEQIKRLLSYLPQSNAEKPPDIPPTDSPDRTDPSLDEVVPKKAEKAYDMKTVIRSIVDNGEFLEPSERYAMNIITCFARLSGHVVGIIASQPNYLAGCLDINASDKATRFIRFCDAFNIPLLTIVDTPGYLPGSGQEWGGIIRHGAKLLWCYSEATVPKITLITRKAYGGAYIAMCSQSLGADYCLAWPRAEIAVMGAEGAAAIIHRQEIKSADDPKAKEKEKIEEYRSLFYNPYVAASQGYINAVTHPKDTRPKIIAALEALYNKKETRPARKHGNIPV